MHILDAIIILLGCSTSYTDIRFKVIKNNHLLAATILGVAAYVYLMVTHQLTVNWKLPLNVLIGFILGLVFYLADLWEAGDAKLFTVFCLLMPTDKYDSTLFFPAIAVFANIFIISFLITIALSIRDIIKDKRRIFKEFFSSETLSLFTNAFLLMFATIWIIEAGVDRFLPQAPEFVSTMLVLACTFGGLFFIQTYKNKVFVFLLLGAAVALRFMFNSLEFNIGELALYLKKTLFFTALFQGIIVTFKLTKTEGENTKIIPFAPLMLLGTLLTHTNLVNGTIELINTLTG